MRSEAAVGDGLVLGAQTQKAGHAHLHHSSAQQSQRANADEDVHAGRVSMQTFFFVFVVLVIIVVLLVKRGPARVDGVNLGQKHGAATGVCGPVHVVRVDGSSPTVCGTLVYYCFG
jgi:hypothetical protein